MRRFLLLYFVLMTSGFAFTNVQPVQASATTFPQISSNLQQTAPLPTTTSITSSSDEIILARLNQPFMLGMRQSATVRDRAEPFSVRLTALVSDNRCPAGVNCFVAGQVEFTLSLRVGTVDSPRQYTIGTYPINDQNKVHYAGYEIELTDVQPPAPASDERLQPNVYVATLVVRRDSAITPEPTATPTTAPTTTPIPSPTPHRRPDVQGTGEGLALNQPFSLHVGESANLPVANIHITLRSLTDESGCLTASDCSLMLAEGTLVLQQGNEREVLTFNASFTPEQPFAYNFAGYVVELVHVEKGDDGEQMATFRVKRPTATVEIPAPQRIARCPDFSRFDAAAILQEEVAKEAIANLVFGPIAPDTTTVAGICGYVTSADSDAQQIDEQAPQLASAVAADRAVVAAVIGIDDIEQIRQLATLITAGDAEASSTMMLRLQTELAAGLYEEMIGELMTIATEIPGNTVTPVAGLGDEGMWLWRPVDDGYFALLLVRDGERFRVVIALLNGNVKEEVVFDYAIVVARWLE